MNDLCWLPKLLCLMTGAQGKSVYSARPDLGSRGGWFLELSMSVFANHTSGLPAVLTTVFDTVRALAPVPGSSGRVLHVVVLTFCPV